MWRQRPSTPRARTLTASPTRSISQHFHFSGIFAWYFKPFQRPFNRYKEEENSKLFLGKDRGPSNTSVQKAGESDWPCFKHVFKTSMVLSIQNLTEKDEDDLLEMERRQMHLLLCRGKDDILMNVLSQMNQNIMSAISERIAQPPARVEFDCNSVPVLRWYLPRKQNHRPKALYVSESDNSNSEKDYWTHRQGQFWQ